MKIGDLEITVAGPDGDVRIKRNRHGVPEITAQTMVGLAFGLGLVHALDRQLQALLMKILLRGRASELLKADPALMDIDRYMRQMNFLPDPERQVARLHPSARRQLEAYAQGFNLVLSSNGLVWELKLMGIGPQSWTVEDCLLIGKAFGFIGLAQSQGEMEKFLVQMIQHGLDEAKIRELFPYLTEPIDRSLIGQVTLAPPMIPETVKWLSALPRFSASNNWVVSGRMSRSGKPILCGDPHLEVNRLPAIWQEVVMRLPDNFFLGATIPGVPGLIIGRTRYVAWSATYSFMDMIDYRIEKCSQGRYWRKDSWRTFRVREETIRIKKRDNVTIKVYENEHGVVEGDPYHDGHYLVMNWAARQDGGAEVFNNLLAMDRVRNTLEAMECLRGIQTASFNFVVADIHGDIGYQMTGRLFNRPKGISGMLPLPGWEEAYDPQGFVDQDQLPTLYNPDCGYIVTANQDLNHLGKAAPINLPMGAYRAEKIEQLLKNRTGLDLEEMKRMHFDLHSLQGERFMEIIRPLLPDTANGNTLKSWDHIYAADSRGAMLFESVYDELIKTVFGDNGFGREVVKQVMKETCLFHDFYGNLDRIMLSPDSPWFGDRAKKDLFAEAIRKGLEVTAEPYGRTRRIMLAHLLFGGVLPAFLGFDHGPIELPGSRATIPQGQIFRSGGRLTTFGPSFRFVTDMADTTIETNLAGGPTDRRFSRWYKNDLPNWLAGVYKTLG